MAVLADIVEEAGIAVAGMGVGIAADIEADSAKMRLNERNK